MADKQFSAKVGAWVRKSNQRATAVFRESVERLIEQAQTPTSEGGKLRVDTGFLRASFTLSLDGMPFGESRNPGDRAYDYKSDRVTVTLAGAELGRTIWGGWSANYARPREFHDGFLRSAVMNWQSIVSAVTREAKARFP